MSQAWQKIAALHPGDVVRWKEDEPLVTILKVKADSYGFDVLYQHNGSAPRWRGFDDGDTVILVERAQ